MSDEQRDLLALSFEPIEGGFLYYHRIGSPGILVSAQEREAYLAMPLISSARRDWIRQIRSRPANAPPRAAGPVRHDLVARIQIYGMIICLLFGAVLLAGATMAATPVDAVISGTLAALVLLLSVWMLYMRLTPRR